MSRRPKVAEPPPGYQYGPRYRPAMRTVVFGLLAIALKRKRVLGRDAMAALAHTPTPPLLVGLDNVPTTGRFVVVANHYERPGLWMAWPAVLIAQAIWERTGRSTRWVAIREWESFSAGGISIPPDVTRRVFARAFHTYGLLAMAPPGATAAERATSMKAALRATHDGEIVGLMPEGDVGPTPELLPAREGAGSFVRLLTKRDAPVLPVGIYEEDNRLVARFGEPYALEAPAGLSGTESDDWASDQVMHAIRDLLPSPLWGAYR